LGFIPACLQISFAVIRFNCLWAFDWNNFCSVGVYGVIRTFPEEIETMLFQVSGEARGFVKRPLKNL
jgi:hypothetical protein